MRMRIDVAALEAMHTHAIETFPDECCGILLREPGGTLVVRRISNIQNEMHEKDPQRYPRTAATAYCGEPGELREALVEAEKPGAGLVAFYHSHPDHEAYFSEEDHVQATPFGEPSYPEALQLVISVFDREVR